MQALVYLQNLSLKLKLTLGAILLGGVLLLVQSTLQFYGLRSEVLERIEAQQFDLLSELVAHMDDQISERLAALAQAGTVVSRSMVSDLPGLERHLREETALLSMVDDLYIFDADGKLLVDWPEKPGRRGLDMSNRDYIQQARATLRPAISRPILGQATRQPIIVLAAPVLDTDGQLFAIIGGVLNLYKRNLIGALAERRVGRSGYFYLVAEDGTTLAHPDKNRIMKPIAAPGANTLLDRAFEGFEGTGEGVNSQGINGLFTFKRLETTRWILASVIPTDEAFNPIHVIQQRMIITTLILIMVLIPLLWVSVQYLVKPLAVLAEAMRERAARMRRREPLTPVDESGSQEIRTVAHAFNAMSRAVQERQAEMAAINAELRNLSIVAAHHLQEPVRPLVSYSQLISQQYAADDPEAREWMGYVHVAGARLKSLLRDFQRYISLLSEIPNLEPQPVGEVIRIAADRALADADGVSLSLDFPPDCRVMADRLMLIEIFAQLFDNAWNHRGDRELITLTVSACVSSEGAAFVVTDDGPGIPAELLGRVVLPFERVGGARPTSTGFGLAFCSLVVRAHGGAMTIDSGTGGTSVRFTLQTAALEDTSRAGRPECVGA